MKPRTINAKDGQVIEIKHGKDAVLYVLLDKDQYGNRSVLMHLPDDGKTGYHWGHEAKKRIDRKLRIWRP